MARIWEDSFRCPFENINTTASRLAVLSGPLRQFLWSFRGAASGRGPSAKRSMTLLSRRDGHPLWDNSLVAAF